MDVKFYFSVLNSSIYVAGKHLAEHCRIEYPRVPNFILWIIAEIAIVACDIPEGIKMNCAFGIISLLYLYM